MMKILARGTYLLLLVCTACSGPSPRKLVETCWLNANRVTAYYEPQFFQNLMDMKASNNILVLVDGKVEKGSAETYVQQMLIDPVSRCLQDVASMTKCKDNEAILDASIAVFQFGKKVFEQDYLRMAQRIDEGVSEEMLASHVEALFTARDPEMFKRLDNLDRLILPYAAAHNIKIVNKR